MDATDVLADAFGRLLGDVEGAVTGLGADDLAWRPDPDANPIAWLAWHTARVQDDHVADLADRPQVWIEQGFEPRFGLDLDPRDIGYGHSSTQVASVRVDEPAILLEYLRAVTARTHEVLAALEPADLDRIVDEGWDPPVTAGVRLVSVLDDGLQHAGQAAYVRGLLERRGPRV